MRVVLNFALLHVGVCSTMQKRRVATLSGTAPRVSEVKSSDPGTGGGSYELPVGWLTGVVTLRLASALLSQTTFVPDEYWQSLEVAHRMVFGYGYQTWEWKESIRGYTHPLIYAVLYKALSLLNIDYAYLLVELPKVLNALLGVICDVYVFKLASHLYGHNAGAFALLCNVSSWFLFYCLPRSLTNSLETVLTAPLLYHWFMAVGTHSPHHYSTRRSHTLLYLSLLALAVLVRPTALILGLLLVISHLYWRQRDLRMILQCSASVCVVALLWSFAVDCYFYQKHVFVQWNFFVFNVLQGHSALYGTHPWHWYLSQGGPAVLGTTLPLLLILPCLSQSQRGSMLWLGAVGGWVVLAHSLLAHKEFRFIMCVVPIASILGGRALQLLFSSKKWKVLGWCGCVAMLANLPAIFWFCLVHQRGTLDVLTYLRSNITDESSVLFLMPCHSTPYYSHIHRDIVMEFLECPPPLHAGDKNTEKEFYQHPETWLNGRFPMPHSHLPTHIVMYDTLVKEIESFLRIHSYKEVTRLFHTLHPLRSEMGTYIVVYNN